MFGILLTLMRGGFSISDDIEVPEVETSDRYFSRTLSDNSGLQMLAIEGPEIRGQQSDTESAQNEQAAQSPNNESELPESEQRKSSGDNALFADILGT